MMRSMAKDKKSKKASKNDGAEAIKPKKAKAKKGTAIAAKSDLERQESKAKTGVFLGTYATNPVSGKKVPIFIADYVLTGYGTGAIMAVPAHDTRDYEFAQAFGLPITEVVSGGNVEEEAWTEDGALVNSANDRGLDLNGLNKAEAIAQAIEHPARRSSGLTRRLLAGCGS